MNDQASDLAIAMYIAGANGNVVQAIARRCGAGVDRWKNGWSGAEIYSERFVLGNEQQRRATLDAAADEIVALYRNEIEATRRRAALEVVELRFTIITNDDMNADFYLPRVLTDAVHDYSMDVYFGAL